VTTITKWLTVSGNVPMASAQDDPCSDKAYENMLDLEGKQDVRTEPDSTLPDSDQGGSTRRFC
jgi:hypothetical protein